jgi:hypothetical protein
VDDKLHAQIVFSLLRYKAPRTLVLVTGDGNDNGGVVEGVVNTSFYLV